MTARWTEQKREFVHAAASALCEHMNVSATYDPMGARQITAAVCLWLGHVEAANECVLAEIVRAAAVADVQRRSCHVSVARDGRNVACGRRGICPQHAPGGAATINLGAFAAALVLEAYGVITECASLCGCGPSTVQHEGPCVPVATSWFAQHAEFVLGELIHYADCSSRAAASELPPCDCGAVTGRQFVLPGLVLEYTG